MVCVNGVGFTSLDSLLRNDENAAFESELRLHIIGQEEIIQHLSEIHSLILANLTPPQRPMASLLLLGPTGTGKTLSVETLSSLLFGIPNAFIKINCAEFRERHEIAKILGAPPGYLGHRETQPLITAEKLRRFHTTRHPFSFILFDEIEKADFALFELLLGILDKAELTTGAGEHVDLTKVIIFMTSNLGSKSIDEVASHSYLGFTNPFENPETRHRQIEATVIQAARKKFSPEFINRIDRIVVFQPLKTKDLEQILDLEIQRIQKTLVERGHTFILSITQAARQYLLAKGTNERYGARQLRRVIEQELVVPCARFITTKQLENAQNIHVDFDGIQLIFSAQLKPLTVPEVEIVKEDAV